MSHRHREREWRARVASIDNLLASLRAQLPDGWELTGPTTVDDGWTIGIHPTADPILGEDVWDPELDVALRRIGESITSLRASQRPN